jgi:peptidoglycan/xylan/chitin deacetylase (PgdA/CDA1 family)
VHIEQFPTVWMFHYVLPADDHSTPIPNRVTLEEFRLFLDHLQENTRVLSPDEFNSYLESPRFPDACSLLTFDDGLSGHCSHVVPELARRGLKALFFVATQPLITQRMLIVHQIHCLAGAIGYETLRSQYSDALKALRVSLTPQTFCHPAAGAAYQYDSLEVAEFKYALNYLIPADVNTEVINELFYKTFGTTTIPDFYMTERQLRLMHDDGMTIGCHGNSHVPFSQLAARGQLRAELTTACGFLHDLLGAEVSPLSYPYGDSTSVNHATDAVVLEMPISYAFLAEPTKQPARIRLPRLDCVGLRHRTKPVHMHRDKWHS